MMDSAQPRNGLKNMVCLVNMNGKRRNKPYNNSIERIGSRALIGTGFLPLSSYVSGKLND